MHCQWLKKERFDRARDNIHNNFLYSKTWKTHIINIEMLARNSYIHLFRISTVYGYRIVLLYNVVPLPMPLLFFFFCFAAANERACSNVVEKRQWKYERNQNCLAREENTRAGTYWVSVFCWAVGWCQESTDELSALVEMFVFASSSNVLLRCYIANTFLHLIFHVKNF